MEVKDVQRANGTKPGSQIKQAQTRQRSISSLKSTEVALMKSDSVNVEIDRKPKRAETNAVRQSASNALNVMNIAEEATREIEGLIRSIGGIVEQAQSEESDSRKAVLEEEARSLAEEIRNTAKRVETSKTSALADEKFAEIEQKIGRSLETILPDRTHAFDIGEMEFSKKENIIRTIANVAKAREQIEDVRSSLGETRKAVAEIVNSLEVAVQNSEAAEASVREVDQALRLASSTGDKITANEEEAFGSVGAFSINSLKLLNLND